jgi:hypothetical protein
MIIRIGCESVEKKHPIRSITVSEPQYCLAAWQRAEPVHVIVSAFRVAGLVPWVGHDDRYSLAIERSAAIKARYCSSGTHAEDGVEPAGKKREKL